MHGLFFFSPNCISSQFGIIKCQLDAYTCNSYMCNAPQMKVLKCQQLPMCYLKPQIHTGPTFRD